MMEVYGSYFKVEGRGSHAFNLVEYKLFDGLVLIEGSIARIFLTHECRFVKVD